MPQQEQYTIEEAKRRAKELGKEWTPGLEQQLRAAGKIADAAPASAGMPWLRELGLGIGEMVNKAQQVVSPALMNPAEALLRAQTGTTPSEQMTAGALGGISAGNINREMLDIPEPTSNVQRGFDLAGQGLGMSTAFIPIGGATNLAVRGIANPLARRVAGGALGFAGYNAFQPAESVGEWAQNVGEGALTGGIVGMIPKPMGQGVANAIGRGAVDLGTFGTMGAVDRIRSDPNLGAGDFLSVLPQSLAEAVPQMAGMGVVHGMTNRTPERLAQTPAEAEAYWRGQADADAAARAAAGYPEQARAEAFRAVRAGEASIWPDPQMKAEAEALRVENEMALRRQAGAEAAAAKEEARKADLRSNIDRQVARAEQIRMETDRKRADEEAVRQAEVDARLGDIRAAREARGSVPVETPIDPLAGPVSPSAGPEPGYRYPGDPVPRQEPGMEPAMENIGTDPVAQNQRTMDRIRAMQAMRDARLQQPQEPVQAPAEAPPQVAEQPVQPELPMTTDQPTKPRGDVTLGSGPAQAMWEQASKILSGARQRRQAAQAAKPKGEFELAKEELAKPVDEHPDSVPFNAVNQGKKSFRDAVMDVARRHRTVSATPEISYPEKANDAQKADIDRRNEAAIRQRTGNAVPDFIDAMVDRGLKKLRGKHVGFTDPVRKTQEISDGEMASAIEMSEIHGGREIEMAARKHADEIGSEYADLKKRTGVTDKRQLEIAGRLLDRYVSNGRTRRANDAEFIRDPENLKLLVESGTPGMLDYVKGVRDIMDRMREVAHEANIAMGGEGIGDLEAYFPKVAGKPKFFDLREKAARSAAKEGRDPRSLATATETFNPRAERRSSTDPEMVDLNGRQVPREWNAETVLEGYVDTMLRSATGDIALGQSRDIAKYMDIKANAAERAGDKETAKQLRIRANVVRNLASQKWAHNLFGAGAVADALPGAFGAPGSVAKDLIAANKRAFDNAKYRLNPRFNLVTQWTSIINPIMSDPVAGLMALRDMGVPFSKNAAKDFAGYTYEARRKSMPHSQMRAQIEGAGNIAQIGDIPNTPKKIANTFMDGLTQAIENSANKYSALVAYHATRNMKGLTPRQRALAAGQGVFKTQSAFTFGERPGILNSRVVQGTFPAQGYAIELANQIREALGHTGVDTRLYGESKGQQYAHAGGIIGAAIMQNVWQNLVFNAMRGKDPEESLNFDSIWDATVALPPFISAFLPTGRGGSDMPQPPLPIAQMANVINKGKRAAVGISEGDLAPTKKLLEYVASQSVTGGTFASDISSGKYTNIIDTVSGGGGEAAPGPVTPVRPAKITTTRGRIAPVRVAPKKSGGLR